MLRAQLTPGGSFAAALSRVSREWTWAYARAEMVPLAAWDQLLPDAEPLPYVMLFDWISESWCGVRCVLFDGRFH
eukprot:COSAG01_NODE_11096_length_2009_cov_4.966492_2_plen_75_part_00